MKSVQEIKKDLFATLHELETRETMPNHLQNYLTTKLSILYDILGEEVPEEYWERIENFIWVFIIITIKLVVVNKY